MGEILYYKDVRTMIDLQKFTRLDFNNENKYKNEQNKEIDGKNLVQIGGVPISHGYMWCTFRNENGNEFFCYCVDKSDDSFDLLSKGKTFDEMYENFLKVIRKLWRL